MQELSNKNYWEKLHNRIRADEKKSPDFLYSIRKKIRTKLDKYFPNYSEYLLWNIIYPKYLQRNSTLKIFEVGAAPGGNLIKFHKKFGYIPYGIEYSWPGVELCKKKFSQYNLNSDNIIHGDFFSGDFQVAHQNYFDIVYSRGFIEHFSDPSYVIDMHLNLLKEGGKLIIIIPNLRGFNSYWAKFLNHEILSLHNLSIMNKKIFSDLFKHKNLEEAYCNYYGFFSFGLFNANTRNKIILHKILMRFQYLLNFIFRFLFRGNPPENKYFSPYLIYTGTKITIII